MGRAYRRRPARVSRPKQNDRAWGGQHTRAYAPFLGALALIVRELDRATNATLLLHLFAHCEVGGRIEIYAPRLGREVFLREDFAKRRHRHPHSGITSLKNSKTMTG